MRLDDTDGGATTFVVRFHGVRGSHPVAAPEALHFGGNTSCVEVEAGSRRVILDCGTGAIGLGRRMLADHPDDGRPLAAALLVSHAHHDHTMGFPFFAPVYRQDASLHVFGPGSDGRGFQDVLEDAFANPFFPVAPRDMPSQRHHETLADGDVLSWVEGEEGPRRVGSGECPAGLVIRAFRNTEHPNGGVLNFRLELDGRSLVLATDVEGTAGESGDLVDFARSTDLLIHDAQYTDEEYAGAKEGWGHSTWRMAADVAWRSQARRLVLYHHDPAHDDQAVEDIERGAREKFPRCVAACEGMEIRL